MKPAGLANDKLMGRPHVYILGAGASYAAFPRGEKTGRKLPLMNNLVEILQLSGLLERHGVKYGGENFETLYSELHGNPEKADLLAELEESIRAYFGEMRLSEEPTLYDHLVLSLREKDVVATFNWDPFLWQACARNSQEAGVPCPLFLHGNVAVGYCLEHKQKGPTGGTCTVCGRPYQSSRLLFPVAQKNYSADPFISAEWKTLREALKDGFILTIFGYGAPSSDVEAVDLMKTAWDGPASRQFEEVEIVDIKSVPELTKTWSPFIFSHHYTTGASFYSSISAQHPRRSCEATWGRLMECQFLESTPVPADTTFDGLYEWLWPLFKSERQAE